MAKKLGIDDLAPAPYNPRDISKKAGDGLSASLERFGDISGITYNRRTSRLLGGHQRVERLRALGAQMLDGALQLANGDRFPVRVVDWSEGKEKEANVAANNPHIAGTFNDALDELLAELAGGMSEDEFAELRYDDLLDDLAKHKGGSDDADTSPQLGDGLMYSVIIDFDNETEQAKLLEEMEKRGYKCRLLMS